MDFDEFMALISTKLQVVDVYEEIVEAFHVFDTEGHGTVKKSTLREMLLTFGDYTDESEIDYILPKTDKNKDELIDYCSESLSLCMVCCLMVYMYAQMRGCK